MSHYQNQFLSWRAQEAKTNVVHSLHLRHNANVIKPSECSCGYHAFHGVGSSCQNSCKSEDILPFFLLACHCHPFSNYTILDDPKPLDVISASTLYSSTEFYCKTSAGKPRLVLNTISLWCLCFFLTLGLVTSLCRGQAAKIPGMLKATRMELDLCNREK